MAQLMQRPLLIDDQLGRQAARCLGLVVAGTVGVVIEAKRGGLVSAVRPLLEEMQAQGYWLSDKLINLAVALAGE